MFEYVNPEAVPKGTLFPLLSFTPVTFKDNVDTSAASSHSWQPEMDVGTNPSGCVPRNGCADGRYVVAKLYFQAKYPSRFSN